MVPGLIRAGFWGISGKLNIYHAAKILFLEGFLENWYIYYAAKILFFKIEG